MRAKIAAGAIAMLLVAAPARANMLVAGQGLHTCGTYLTNARSFRAERQSSPNGDASLPTITHFLENAWVQGYVTARDEDFLGEVALLKKEGRKVKRVDDLLKGYDANAMEIWLENYCRAHPLNLLVKAAQEFTTELERRHVH